MMVTFHSEASHVVIHLDIEKFDAARVPEFKASIKQHDLSHAESVDINLSTVAFIDSSGVGALLTLYKALPHQHTPMRIVGPRRNVRDVIELLRLHRIFEVVDPV